MKFKETTALLVSCVLTLSSTTFVFASDTTEVTTDATAVNTDIESSETEELTVESYKSWLTSQSRMRNSDNSQAASNALNDFNNLPDEKQELLVEYINDDDLLLEIFESINNSNSNEEIALKNGNIIISHKIEKSTPKTRATYSDSYSDSIDLSVLGIKIFEYSGDIRYRHNGSKITKIDHANIWISANLLPLVDYDWDNGTPYGVGTDTAILVEYCTWSFVHSKFGMQYGTHQLEIAGTVDGYGWFY